MLTEKHVDDVTGYADGAVRVMRELGVTKAALDEGLLDFNVEECPNCHWYTESFNLLDDDDGVVDGFCDNCRHYDKPAAG